MVFFFQAEDGIRYLVRSRGLGDVYKRRGRLPPKCRLSLHTVGRPARRHATRALSHFVQFSPCLLYTSDAADERSSVDLGGRRNIKKKKIYNADVVTEYEHEQD